MEGVEGVGRDSRKMVEACVEGESWDGREGSEGLERQEVVVSENSASHEVSGSSQGGGCQGKHRHGLNTTQLSLNMLIAHCDSAVTSTSAQAQIRLQ